MKKYILGISCFFHDSAACLISDGVIIAAAQEERFSRIKHDSSFPMLSINFCLEQASISEAEIDVIVYYEKILFLITYFLPAFAIASVTSSVPMGRLGITT